MTRARANCACSCDRVTPTACTPNSWAAYSASAPHPQPTSSSRCPGRRASLRQTTSSLVALRVLQADVRRRPGPVGAGVDHRRPEDELVEVVADVVVVADGRGVGALVVAHPAQPARADDLLRRQRWPAAEGAQPGQSAHGPQLLARGQAQPLVGGELGHQLRGGERGVQVTLDVEIAGDEGAGQAELVGLPQQGAQGAAGTEDDGGGGTGRAGLAAVPAAEPIGQSGTQQLGHQRREAAGNSGRHPLTVGARGAGPVARVTPVGDRAGAGSAVREPGTEERILPRGRSGACRSMHGRRRE